MKVADYIGILQGLCHSNEDRTRMAADLPLGVNEQGDLVFSRREQKTFAMQHTCVTGSRKTAFIKRLLLNLSRLYTQSEVNFLIVSPYLEYGALLRLNDIDCTVPFIRGKEDLDGVKACLQTLIDGYTTQSNRLKLVLVLDGLEELEGCNQHADLEEYREIFDLIARQNNIVVISGAELMTSIFSGYPGAFVGLGNCLVTTREHGKADVTYVDDDSSLSLPISMTYADLPTVDETVMYFNENNVRIVGANE